MKTSFINEEEFIQEMSDQWEAFGNKGVDRFVPAWSQILESFNNQLSGKPGLHVCDSVCGSGKTLAAEVASALLSKNWEDVGTLVVVRLTEQCVDVSQRINDISVKLTGKCVARPMFSRHTTADGNVLTGNLTEEEIQDTQVIVITHANYLRTISGRKDDFFSTWRRGKRKFRVIDESLDLVERFTITREEMGKLGPLFELRRDASQFYTKWANHIQFYDDIKRHMIMRMDTEGIYSQAFLDIIDNHRVNGYEIYFSEMIPEFRDASKKDFVKKFKEGQFEDEMDQVIDILSMLDRMIRRSLYFSQQGTSASYTTGQVILPSHFDSLCVLDATSNVDKIYSLFRQREQFTPYEVDRSIRNFRNCRLHVRPESAGLGLGVTKKQVEPRAKKVIKWAEGVFDEGDKVLFAGHKVLMEGLSKQLEAADPEFGWDVCWWNAIDGRNTWKEFNKLVVLSVNYMPPSFDSVTKIGFQSKINPDVQLVDDSTVSDSTIAVKIIQLLARIQTRRVINDEGDCPESDVFILLPGKDINPDDEDEVNFLPYLNPISHYLLNEIQTSMNGVSINHWTSFSGFAQPSNPKEGKGGIQDRFIEWIKDIQPGEVYDKKDFEKTLTDSEKQTLNVMLSKERSRVTRHLESFYITRRSTRGRYGTTTFTKEA